MPPKRRYELTDEQWALIAPLMPKRKPGGRWNDHRATLDGMMWVLKSGSPWRDTPKRYGSWKSVYDRFRRWSADGTIDKILVRASWHLGRDPAAVRSDHPRGSACLQPGDLQGPQRGRTVRRLAEAQPPARHPLREAGGPLPVDGQTRLHEPIPQALGAVRHDLAYLEPLCEDREPVPARQRVKHFAHPTIDRLRLT